MITERLVQGLVSTLITAFFMGTCTAGTGCTSIQTLTGAGRFEVGIRTDTAIFFGTTVDGDKKDNVASMESEFSIDEKQDGGDAVDDTKKD